MRSLRYLGAAALLVSAAVHLYLWLNGVRNQSVGPMFLINVVAGVVLSGYVGYVDRYLGRGFDLDSITAAVIGGTAFTGGRASLLGTMAGVLLVQVLSSMLLVLGLDIEVQLIVKGLVVIAAVALYSSSEQEV